MDSLTNVIITTLLCFLTMVSPSTASPLQPNVTLIQRACNKTMDHEFCLNYLSKTPQVVSASLESSSPLGLAAAIAEAALANAQKMRVYAANKIARSPAVKTAYAECARLLDGTTLQLRVAVNILKTPAALTEMGASEDASQSLMTSIDGVAGCVDRLGAVKVEDQYVKTSTKQVEVCSVAADSILTDLKWKRN